MMLALRVRLFRFALYTKQHQQQRQAHGCLVNAKVASGAAVAAAAAYTDSFRSFPYTGHQQGRHCHHHYEGKGDTTTHSTM